MSNMQTAYQRTPARRAEPAEEAPLAKVMSKNDRQREMMRKLQQANIEDQKKKAEQAELDRIREQQYHFYFSQK